MKIVGCDLHAGQQSIAIMDSETGELTEKVLKHEANAVREFYGSLEGPVVVGIEATGAMQWFFGIARRIKHSVSGGSSCQDPCGRDPPTETRSSRCRRDLGITADEESFSRYLDAVDRTTGLRSLLRDRHQWVKMRARLQHILQLFAWNWMTEGSPQ